MDYVMSVVELLAGLGAFLLGFKFLSDNIEKLAMNKLRGWFDGLLFEYDFQAQPFDLHFLFVDLRFHGFGLFCKLGILPFERADRVVYRLAVQIAHLYEQLFQLRELFVELSPCHINRISP